MGQSDVYDVIRKSNKPLRIEEISFKTKIGIASTRKSLNALISQKEIKVNKKKEVVIVKGFNGTVYSKRSVFAYYSVK